MEEKVNFGYPRRPIAFFHLIKAAGTTLERILKRQYGESVVMEFGSPQEAKERLAEYSNWPEDRRGKIDVFMGHIRFEDHDKLPEGCTYITLLRDPVDRIMSDYYYILTRPEHEFHRRVTSANMSLIDLVRSGFYHSLDNHQTKYLSGVRDLEYGSYSSEVVDIARENLQKHFSVAGLTERFDESVILMKRTLGWRTPYYVREKVTPNRPGKESLTREELECIQEYSRMDQELYQFVRDRFEEQIVQQDESFQQEVQAFKRLNPFCQPYLPSLALPREAWQAEYILIISAVNNLVQSQKLEDAYGVVSYALRQYPDSPDLLKLQAMLKSYTEDTLEKNLAPQDAVVTGIAPGQGPAVRVEKERFREDRPLIFLHQKKAGGTTLRRIIKRQYGVSRVHDFQQNSPNRFAEIPPGVKVIEGHIQFGFGPKLPAPASWITMLRDPVARMISDYNYHLEPPDYPNNRKKEESLWYNYARTRSIKDFILDGLFNESENAQVKYLSGEVDVPFGQATPRLLEKAKENLKKHFFVVGLMERFDETLILLKKTLDWKTPYYVRENVSRRRMRKEDLSPDELDIVEKHHRLDRELHNYAQELFADQISRQDSSFRDEVQVFGLLNQHCHRYMSALENPSNFPDAEINIAVDAVHSLLRDELHEQALLVLSYILKKYPNSPDLFNLEALTRYKMGRIEEAKKMFADLIRRWPEHPAAYNYLGAILWDAGDIEGAMRSFLTALKIDPYHRSTVINCGKALVNFNRCEDARTLYSFYIEKNPRDGEVLWLRNNLSAGETNRPSVL